MYDGSSSTEQYISIYLDIEQQEGHRLSLQGFMESAASHLVHQKNKDDAF